MIEFTEYFEPKETGKSNLESIRYTGEVSDKVEAWNRFILTNRQIINIIIDQSDMTAATEMALEWHSDIIALAKIFYEVGETTNQVDNNIRMLTEDVLSGRFENLERTYITTFTNVAKYQV